MCAANPDKWVTFDDENLFQSPRKALIFPHDNVHSPKASELKLSLSHELKTNVSSSNSTTPHSSPINDFFMSPGPPSNSPLCTPIKDTPSTPCTTKQGSFNLYPIAEKPQNHRKLFEGSTNQISTVSSPVVTKDTNQNASPCRTNYSIGHFSVFHFDHGQSDCAFSSPFWNNDATSFLQDPSTKNDSVPKENKPAKQEHNISEKETSSNNQKSLNQCSFSYVCERLQHLKIDPPDNSKHQPGCVESESSSFIPQNLFRSQRKDGWPFMLRIPEKKNMMSSRQWGPIYLKVVSGGILQMYYEKGLEKPFKEFQLHQFCRLSETKLENLGVSDKIHTVKIENISYVEKRKYHPKPEVIHEAEIEQMLKLGTTEYSDLLDFILTMEEELLLLSPVLKQKKTYEEPEMSVELVDNFWGQISKEGKLRDKSVVCQLYCLNFLNSGMECFLTLNDLELQKLNYFDKTSEKNLIHILEYHFHKCVKQQEFEKSRIVKFTPIDACRFELMRFKVPCDVKELPFSLKSLAVVQGAYVELQAFLNMSSSMGGPSQVKYCENITIHFPVPAQWVKALWTVSLQRQRSLKTKMNRRACLSTGYEIESEPVIQVTIGTAKYENAYKAVVWKVDRLPDKNSSPDQPHSLSCKLELGSDQEIPRNWNPMANMQFIMPFTCVSGAEVKSMGVENDLQPHKHVTQKTCYNIQVEIDRKRIPTDGEDMDKTRGCRTQ
ncbi:stonin-1 isoform 1-T2 [Anomaloglossus baeobatrachus]|uniref:stonin-1 n=1 Tax=Anomaloglossus baeobatrachus TaxID=238106 RepID=UPI003F4F8032